MMTKKAVYSNQSGRWGLQMRGYMMICSLVVIYRASHLLVQLGWVNLDFECSSVCLILLGLPESTGKVE